MTTTARKLRFGAFFSVPSCHPTGWRHPDAIPETDLSPKLLLRHGAHRRARQARLHVLPGFGRHPRQHRGLWRPAVPGEERPAGAYRADERDRRARRDHEEHRPDLDLHDLVQRALQRRAPLPHHRPYQRRPRRLEPRHLAGRGRGGELRPRPAFRARHPLRARRRSSTTSWSACGTRWEDDAFLRDKASGQWFDYDKMHILNHKGEYFNVRGPLNVARSPQGRPVVAQAGSSDVGMELAARTADLVFTAQDTIPEGRAFRDDIHARMEKYGRAAGRDPHLPGHPADRRPHRWPRRRRNTRSCARWSMTASASPRWRGWRAASTSSRSIPTGRCRRSSRATPRARARTASSPWASAA